MSLPRLAVLPRTLHTTQRPSATAQWTTLVRALERQRPAAERIVDDPYAPLFLTGAHRAALHPLAAAAPAVRRLERSGAAGIATSVLCRHAFIDAHLLGSLPGVEQVIVLGAGYDSRAYRFAAALGDRPVYEVDLAPLSRAKAAVVQSHPERFGVGSVTRVEIDFRAESLTDRLAASGFRPHAPCFVVWEGVSMYLTEAAVLGTLRSLADVCGPGSVLAMDFWQSPRGRAPYDHLRRTAVRSMRLIGEPITFATPPDAAVDLLRSGGFRVDDLADGRQLTGRYATGGRRCDDALYTVAATLP
ncbi:SAM-dependent methyltransferase [uncultured Jatrophihabitans sp.]|uniref:SAM-dependent methyltransferase n=1 Tax=uncultured Jatrophihabitans sp. TaxID=1610747 RepID=UPI0035CB49D7